MNKTSVVMRFYRVERFLYVHKLKILALLIYRFLYLLFNCVIPPTAILEEGVNIAHGVGIVIHHQAVIGRNTVIFQNVTIGGGPIRIGNGCLIGSGAVVLADVADHVKIGANAVVHKPIVESYVTAVGVPARLVNVKGEKTHCVDAG